MTNYLDRVAQRDRMVERIRDNLQRVAKAPSQFPAWAIRDAATDADELIATLITDLKGWESDHRSASRSRSPA